MKYSTEFTVGTTDTWEEHTVTVPGDIDGTAIADDNGIGLELQFMMAVGATGTTSAADAWNASGATELATANQVNLLDNTSNNVLITGIEYRQGTSATARETEISDYGQELHKAKRYFERMNAEGLNTHVFASGMCSSTTSARIPIFFEVEKRATPTMSNADDTHFQVRQADFTAQDVTNLTYTSVTRESCRATAAVAANLVAGNATILNSDTGNPANIDIDAEL